MEDSRESTLKKNDEIDGESYSSYVEDLKAIDANNLENPQDSKRCRYLIPNIKTPSTDPLNTRVYKRKQKKCLVKAIVVTLSEEIVLKIFKMLDKSTLVTCTRVCHQWRRIAYDKSLWQTFNIYTRIMSVSTLDHLLARNIKYFSASHSNFDIFNDQYYCKTPFPELQYLDLSSVTMHFKTLRSLLSQCQNLIKLSLESCSVDTLCFRYIGRNTNLKVLNLALTVGLNRSGLKHILSLQNLEELNVAWAKMEGHNLKHLMANMIPNIKRLNISGFADQLEDSDLSRMSSRCTKLIELDISDNYFITEEGLDEILEGNQKLEVLTMNRCVNISTPRLLNPTEIIRRKRISIMSLKEVNYIYDLRKIFGDEINILADPDLDLTIPHNTFSSIGRPKLAYNEHTIWEIHAFVDS